MVYMNIFNLYIQDLRGAKKKRPQNKLLNAWGHLPSMGMADNCRGNPVEPAVNLRLHLQIRITSIINL